MRNLIKVLRTWQAARKWLNKSEVFSIELLAMVLLKFSRKLYSKFEAFCFDCIRNDMLNNNCVNYFIIIIV